MQKQKITNSHALFIYKQGQCFSHVYFLQRVTLLWADVTVNERLRSLRHEVKMSSVAWGTRLYTRPEADKRSGSPYTHSPTRFSTRGGGGGQMRQQCQFGKQSTFFFH